MKLVLLQLLLLLLLLHNPGLVLNLPVTVATESLKFNLVLVTWIY